MNITVLTSSTALVPSRQRLRNGTRVAMRKAGIHPEFYEEAKVFCKGEHVLTVSGTQDEYHVEIWSGNHPFFQGNVSSGPVEEGPLSKFASKYEELGDLIGVPDLASEDPEGLDQFKQKAKKKKTKG